MKFKSTFFLFFILSATSSCGGSGGGSGNSGSSNTNSPTGTNVIASKISTGPNHSCVLLSNDNVKCWGENSGGQLGIGDDQNRGDGPYEMGSSLPVINLGSSFVVKSLAVGGIHTCALSTVGKVKCWGQGDYGELGLGATTSRGKLSNEMGENLLAINLGSGKLANKIAAGNSNSCAVISDGSLKCWGGNWHGQLGQGDTTNRGLGSMGDSLSAINLGTFSVSQISVGPSHICALSDFGKVKCWGKNNYGQLGVGDTTNRGDQAGQMGTNLPLVDLGTSYIATQVAVGGDHTCALLSTGKIKCWGKNFNGILGLGDTSHRGDQSNEMGENLPVVDLGNNYVAIKLMSGTNHNCAILNTGKVKCWGDNSVGQLGTGDTIARGAGVMGNSLPTIDLGTNYSAKEISGLAGTDHSPTCVILDTDKVKCWGKNNYGQLGLGHTDNRGDNPSGMGDNLINTILN